MDKLLPYFVDKYIESAKTFGLDFNTTPLVSKDISSANNTVFEISYSGHTSGFFRLVFDNKSLNHYRKTFDENDSEQEVIALFQELMKHTIEDVISNFAELEHTTAGIPRSYCTPVFESAVPTKEASILDKNTKAYINIFLHRDFRKTDLSKELEKQQQETQMIPIKAQKLENEKHSPVAQKFEAIGQLAAGVAHEINTPVQFVGDNINFLHESFETIMKNLNNLDRINLDYFKEEVPAALSESKEGLSRIANIVKSLKEFSHPGNDKIQLYSIKKLIDNCVALTRNEWKYISDIALDIEDLKVKIFPNKLSQVFVNIIVNSAQSIQEKFGNKKLGKIRIKFYKNEEDFTFEVSDNGGGIAEENVEKVFNPFFTTKEIGKGTGQGLTISKKIIEKKHNGSISISENSPEGLSLKIIISENSND